MDDSATMELHPHGTSPENNRLGTGIGIVLVNDAAKIKLSDNSAINIDCDNSSLTGPGPDNSMVSMPPNNPNLLSTALYASTNSKIEMNGKNSNFNINVDGTIYSNNPAVYIGGMTQDISNSSSFSVTVKNPGTYNPNIGVVYIANI